MRLERLNILDAPGVAGLPELHFGAGLNVVVGSNGSGKSTIAQLISESLWRDKSTPRGEAVLHWRFATGNPDPLRYRLSSANMRPVEREGAPVPAGQESCYHLAIADLIRAGKEDKRLAQEIHREMTGGLDLLRRLEELKPRPRAGATEEKALRKAKDQLKEIERDSARLAADEDSLVDLRSKHAAAKQAARRERLLAARRDELSERERMAEAERRLAELPQACGRLNGNELETLAALRSDLTDSDKALRRAEDSVRTTEQKVTSLGFGETPIDASLPERLKTLADQIVHILDKSRREREEVARARAENSLLEQLNVAGISERVLPPRERTRELLALSQKAARLALQREAVDTSLSELIDPDITWDRRNLEEAERTLERWLAIPDALPEGTTRLFPFGLVLTAGGLALLAVNTAWAWPVTAFGGGLALAGYMFGRTDAQRALLCRDAESAFDGLEAPTPAAWERQRVRTVLGEVRGALDDLGVLEQNAQQRRILEKKRAALRAAEEDARGALEELASEWGLTVDDNPLNLTAHLDRLAEHAATAKRILTHEGALSALEEELAGARQRATEALTTLGTEAAVEPLDLPAQLIEVADDIRKHNECLESLVQRRIDLAGLREARNNDANRIDALFEGLDIAPGDEGALAGLLRAKQAWDNHADTLRDARALAQDHASRTEGEDEIVALAAEALEDALEQASQAAARQDDWQDQIARIEQRIETAGGSQAMQEALQRVQKAEDDLAEKRQEKIDLAIQYELVSMLAERHRLETQPEVLARARDLFTAFTRRRWDLQLSADGEFSARDTDSGATRDLEELSTGTRMQLLIAARLAWAEAQEGSEKLPLFLDEALSSSDVDRSREVAWILAELAADGRQIFYFTVDPDDIGVLKEAAQRKEAPFQLMNLDEERGRQVAASWQNVRVPEPRPTVSRPGSATPAEYARTLGAKPLAAAGTADESHVIHLLPDRLDLVYLLVSQDLSTLGRWRTADQDGIAHQFLTEKADQELMRARERLHRSVLRHWRRGRGRPLPSNKIADWGFSDKANADQMVAYLDTRGGDVAGLLAAIEAREIKIRQPTPRKLRERAIEEGYLDEQDILSRTALSSAVRRDLDEDIRSGLLDGRMIEDHITGVVAMLDRESDEPGAAGA